MSRECHVDVRRIGSSLSCVPPWPPTASRLAASECQSLPLCGALRRASAYSEFLSCPGAGGLLVLASTTSRNSHCNSSLRACRTRVVGYHDGGVLVVLVAGIPTELRH
eukprot:523874-Rhodomonas_salina.1